MSSKKVVYSNIDINFGKVNGFKDLQYLITVNDISINKYLNDYAKKDYFNQLVPPIRLFNKKDQEKVDFLLNYKNIVLPLLVCSDDMDLSCIVVSCYVVEEKDAIVWKSFGYGLDMTEIIYAPQLYFKKDNYENFIQKFKLFIQEVK